MDPQKQNVLNTLEKLKDDLENDRVSSIALAVGYVNPATATSFFLMGTPELAYFNSGMIQKAIMDMLTEPAREVPAPKKSDIVLPFGR